ncbi:MAG: hypothetical protein ACFFGZ_08580 [Candidatus Thorarchaeota archaeon]
MTTEHTSKGIKRAKNSLDDNITMTESFPQRQSMALEKTKPNRSNAPKNIAITRNLGFKRVHEDLESFDPHSEVPLKAHDIDLDDLHGEDALRAHDADLHDRHGDDNFEFSDSESPALYGDDILSPHGLEALGPPGEDRFLAHGSEDVNLSHLKRKRKPNIQR